MVPTERAEADRGEVRGAGIALAIAFAFVFVSRGVADSWMVFLLPVEHDFEAFAIHVDDVLHREFSGARTQSVSTWDVCGNMSYGWSTVTR